LHFDALPCGFATAPATDGEKMTVQTAGFVSSEDGGEFTSRLEQLTLLSRVLNEFGVPPSRVDHVLAVLQPDNGVTVYCNELGLLGRARLGRPGGVKAGQAVSRDHLLDHDELVPVDATGTPVSIPDDCGVVFLFSVGWRKGMYFDLSLPRPDGRRRETSLPNLFGQYYTQVLFAEMYSATDAQWHRLFECGLFPFTGLTSQDRADLFSLAKFDRDPTPFVEPMCRTFAATLRTRLDDWRRNRLLNRHMEFWTRALDRFEDDKPDYISCLSILTDRIEGVLRTLFVERKPGVKATQAALSANLVENKGDSSVLLPAWFEQYLRRVYYAAFDLQAGEVPFSRNSHAHGVSKAADYDFVRATVAFMVVDQMFHYLTD
jgi:hypothetical protein